MHLKKNTSFPELNGEAFRKAREVAGLSELELANTLCLSAKHIKHIEDNNLAIFFSLAHRYQVAKKIAAHLNLSDENAFIIKRSVIAENTQAADASLNDTSEEPEAEHLNTNIDKQDIALTSFSRHKKKGLLINRSQELVFTLLAIGVGYLVVAFGGNFGKLTRESATEITQTPAEVIEGSGASTSEAPTPDQKSLSTQATSNPCEYSKDNLYSYINSAPDKPANYVHLIAKGDDSVCIIDSENIVTNVNLKHGAAKTVNGKAPFIIVGKDLSKFDIFFQGSKLNNSILQNHQIKLSPG